MHAFLFFRSFIILKRRHLRIASNFFSHICCLKIQKQKKKREGEKEGKTYHSLHANYLLFKYIYIYKIILNEKFEHNTESEAGNDTYSGSSHISLVDLWYR